MTENLSIAQDAITFKLNRVGAELLIAADVESLSICC